MKAPVYCRGFSLFMRCNTDIRAHNW
jgi:hypothetical protein